MTDLGFDPTTYDFSNTVVSTKLRVDSGTHVRFSKINQTKKVA